MNAIKTMATQTQPQAAIPHAKAKKQNGGDFLKMLSYAITAKNAAAKPENAVNPENAAQTADKADADRPAQPLRDKSGVEPEGKITETQDEKPDEKPDETAIASAAAQMLVQVPVDVQPDVAYIAGEIPTQTEEAIPVQAWTVQAARVQTETEPQPQAAQVQDTQAAEQVATAQVEEQKPAYTQTQAPELRAQPNETGQTAKVMQEQTGVQEQAKDQSRTQGDTRTQRQTLPDEADGTIVYAETVRQPDDGPRVRTAVQTEDDPAQARFDGMLAKASQELDRTKTDTVQEQPLAAEEPTLAVDEPETPAKPAQAAVDEPENAVPEEKAVVLKPDETVSENNPATAKRENWQTESVRTHVPEMREQKPAKAARKDEETVATNAVQPKPQHISTHEAIRTQRQEPAQAAKTPDQFEQVRAQVIRNLEDQKMEFNMQLHPEELGKVNVKMILEDGKLAIEIMAANAKSAEILHKQTEALVSSLRMGNLEVTTVNVVTAGENASGHMNDEYNLGNFNGQAGQQDAQSSKTGTGGRSSGNETAGQPEDEAEERQPRGILNYSI